MSSIGDRMKRYEQSYNFLLTPRSCLFIRVDGRAFHSFTRSCDKPFDYNLMDAMVEATKDTAKEMQGFKGAYHQSDEVTFMLTDFDQLDTQGWFNYELNKVVSLSASIFSVAFNRHYGSNNAVFDSRAFIVPESDAPNVFIWRQRDWERNSVQMLARANFSHKECTNKKIPELHDLLHTKGVNWAKLDDQAKNGTYIFSNLEPVSFKADYATLQDKLAPPKQEVDK